MSIYEFDKLPQTSAEAKQLFEDKYILSLGTKPPETWVDQFGDFDPVDATKVRFPLSQLAGQYLESKGDSRFKEMDETELSVKVVEFDLGYRAKMLDLAQSTFTARRWASAPQRMQVAEQNRRAKSIAALLESGHTGSAIWTKGSAFFATDHRANFSEPALGTFSNYQSTPKDPADIDDLTNEIIEMMAVPDDNGEPYGIIPTHILLPRQKYQLVKNMLSQNRLASGETNPLYQALTPVWVKNLTDANDFYLVDANMVDELPCWSALRYQAPPSLAMRWWLEGSDYFNDTGRIKVSSHIWYGFTMVFPHAIRKVAGA